MRANDYDHIPNEQFEDLQNEIEEGGVILGESIPDEEFNDTGFTIIYLFIYLALLAVIATVYFLIYFK